jgi:hypothetical protein
MPRPAVSSAATVITRRLERSAWVPHTGADGLEARPPATRNVPSNEAPCEPCARASTT